MEVRPLQTRVWHNVLEIIVDVIWVGSPNKMEPDNRTHLLTDPGLADNPPRHPSLARGLRGFWFGSQTFVACKWCKLIQNMHKRGAMQKALRAPHVY